MKIAFILNPISGTHRNPKVIESLISKYYDKSSHDYEILYTDYPKHATELAKTKANENYDVVVAIGGDGTVNEVAEGLLHTNTSLGIIPAGSGNGFARHFKIPINQEHAIRDLIHYKSQKIDTGRINGNHFNGVCGMGFDAYVSQKFSEQKERGLKTYVKVMLKEYFKYKCETYHLIIDNNDIPLTCYTLTIANAAEYGNGAVISPNSNVSDGKLEVCAMKQLNFFTSIIIVFRMMTGSLNKSKLMNYFSVENVIIKRNGDVTIHVDGTPMKTDLSVKIEIVKQSLLVMAP